MTFLRKLINFYNVEMKLTFSNILYVAIGLLMVLVPVLIIINSPKDNKPIKTPPKIELKSTPVELLGTGKITTMADGFDVKRVNLFSATSGDRKIDAFLTNGTTVKILLDAEPYYFVETTNGDGKRGYCMKGFVIRDK